MYFFLYVIVLFQIVVFSNEIKIPITNYSNGTFDIMNPGNYPGIWSMVLDKKIQFITGDTVSFSNGTRLVFFSSRGLDGWYLYGYGGYFILDSLTKTYLKNSKQIAKRRAGGLALLDRMEPQFVINENINDKDWDSINNIPKDLIPADSFYYADTIVDTIKNINRKQASYIYRFTGDELPTTKFLWTETAFNYRNIFYLKGFNKSNFKLRVTKYDTIKKAVGPDYIDTLKYITRLTIQWAVDSCGNGKFLGGSTEINRQLNFSNQQIELKIIKQNNANKTTLFFNNRDFENGLIKIYSLKGELFYTTNINNTNNKVSITLASGIYIVSILQRQKTFTSSIYIP